MSRWLASGVRPPRTHLTHKTEAPAPFRTGPKTADALPRPPLKSVRHLQDYCCSASEIAEKKRLVSTGDVRISCIYIGISSKPVDISAWGVSEMSIVETYPPILTSARAAELLQCSRYHVQGLARDGLIPAWRTPNGQWRFSRDRLIAVVAGESRSAGIAPHIVGCMAALPAAPLLRPYRKSRQ